MKFPLVHKKPLHKNRPPKRLLLTDPNSLIGYRIDNGKLKLMSVLGVGGNGVVYHAVECTPDGMPQPDEPRQFAVKALSKIGLEPREVRTLEREFELHTQVSGHPHILRFHGIIDEDDFFFVLLDYIPGGDIFDMMEVHRAYIGNDELIKSVFLQLIDAVEHIHNLGISHRDIKPENILCKDDGSYILLADFGLGTNRKVIKEYGVGSEPYMAPQCFGGFWRNLGPYSAPHADIWSLGVVLVNLACARNPWHKATEESAIYRNFLSNPNYLREILPISIELNEILKLVFAINPQARISLCELRKRVQAIRRFTLTGEELKLATPTVRRAVKKHNDAPLRPTLTPGAPHADAARRITNFSVEDVERLEAEARQDARDASLHNEEEARHSLRSDLAHDDDDDNTCCPSFMSHAISSSPTIAVQESTPGACDIATLDSGPGLIHDRNDSDSDSEVPITPESHAAIVGDAAILSIPEIDLNESCPPPEISISATLTGEQGLVPVVKLPHGDRGVEVLGRRCDDCAFV